MAANFAEIYKAQLEEAEREHEAILTTVAQAAAGQKVGLKLVLLANESEMASQASSNPTISIPKDILYNILETIQGFSALKVAQLQQRLQAEESALNTED